MLWAKAKDISIASDIYECANGPNEGTLPTQLDVTCFATNTHYEVTQKDLRDIFINEGQTAAAMP